MNPAAFILFALAAVGVVAGAGFGIAVGEEAGAALLIGAGLCAGTAGLAAVLTQGRDVAVPTTGREAASLPASPPAVWPLAGALAALVVATGMATGSSLVWLGLAAAAVSGAGWFAQSWSHHPTWTPEQNERVSSRLILPLALPLGVTALVVLLAVAFSRALLAASTNGSVLLALVAALVILGAGVIVSMKSLGRSAILGLLTAGAVVTAALGIGGAVAGEREFHHVGEAGHAEGEDAEAHDEAPGDEHEAEGDAGGAGGQASGGAVPPGSEGEGVEPDPSEPVTNAPREVEIAADDLAFDKERILLPANVETLIVFTNEEAQPHNVAFRSESGETIFRPDGGGIITGPDETVEYEVPPLDEGDYTFFCEVHPAQMRGDLVVS